MATHSSVPAWRIPGKGEPGGLPSMGLRRVGHKWSDLAAAAAEFTRARRLPWRRAWQPTPIFLPGEFCEQRSLADYSPWGLQRVRDCMLLLLLSHFSRVQLCATPQTAAHQAPPSLGFSRQEHWSGLPFLSPMHESEKWKWSRSVVTFSDPIDCSLPGSSVHGIFQARVLEWGAIAFSQRLYRDMIFGMVTGILQLCRESWHSGGGREKPSCKSLDLWCHWVINLETTLSLGFCYSNHF